MVRQKVRSIATFSLVLSLAACAKESSESAKADKAADPAAKVAAATGAARASAELPALDEVLSRHFAALGGEARLRKVQTLTYSGTKRVDGKETKVAKYFKRGRKLRSDANEAGKVMMTAFNGAKGWHRDGDQTKEMPAEKVAHLQKRDSIDDALLTYQQDGTKVRLVGKADVKGAPAFELELVASDHEVERRFIDAASYFETKRVVTWKDKEGKESTSTMYFSDYRDLGDGMMINHRVDFEGPKGAGTFIIESAAYDKPIDDGMFEIDGNIM